MDSNKYLEVLKNEVLPELEAAQETIGGDWRLMQDNAPCHTANIVKAFLVEKEVKFIKWPPYSPDLNPIENVWSLIKRKLMSEFPVAANPDELIEQVNEIWNSFSSEFAYKMCGNYKNRLQAVVKAQGGYTKY